jgi:hypothetical protein
VGREGVAIVVAGAVSVMATCRWMVAVGVFLPCPHTPPQSGADFRALVLALADKDYRRHFWEGGDMLRAAGALMVRTRHAPWHYVSFSQVLCWPVVRFGEPLGAATPAWRSPTHSLCSQQYCVEGAPSTGATPGPTSWWGRGGGEGEGWTVFSLHSCI